MFGIASARGIRADQSARGRFCPPRVVGVREDDAKKPDKQLGKVLDVVAGARLVSARENNGPASPHSGEERDPRAG